MLEWGERGAPVLVLQHGMRDHGRSWDWIAERFASDHHVLVPELRGHGDSDWSTEGAYALSDFVADLAGVVDALDVDVFDLVGHSLGGHISLRYAATFPERVRTLTVIEAIELPIVRDQRREPIAYPQRLRHWIEARGKKRDRPSRYYATVEAAQARMATQNPAIDDRTIAHLTRWGLIAETGKGLRWKFDDACRLRAPDDAHGLDLDEVLDAIACPTLLAYGDASFIPLPATYRMDLLKDCRLVTFPGAGHWLHHQAREPFLRALQNLLVQSPSRLQNRRTAHA